MLVLADRLGRWGSRRFALFSVVLERRTPDRLADEGKPAAGDMAQERQR